MSAYTRRIVLVLATYLSYSLQAHAWVRQACVGVCARPRILNLDSNQGLTDTYQARKAMLMRINQVAVHLEESPG